MLSSIVILLGDHRRRVWDVKHVLVRVLLSVEQPEPEHAVLTKLRAGEQNKTRSERLARWTVWTPAIDIVEPCFSGSCL